MSNFVLQDMQGKLGIATNAVPRQYFGTILAEEMAICFLYFKISGCSVGITALNPAVIKWETSFDDGTTWSDIIGVNIDPITGDGEFFAEFTSNVTHIGPIVRATVTPPAGDTCFVAMARKSRCTEFAQFRAPVSGGGGAGEDTSAITGNAQKASAANYTGAVGLAYVMGWDGTNHRELLLAADGSLQTTAAYNTHSVSARIRYAVTPVTTAAWVTAIASTAFAAVDWDVFDSSGQAMEIAVGVAGSEVSMGIIPPGGAPTFQYYVAAGKRISLKAVSGNAGAGDCVINGRG